MREHFFLVEFGTTGELYTVGCTGDKGMVKEYLQNISRDVRYKTTKEVSPEKFHSNHPIDGGNIIFCKFYCDKFASLSRSKKLTCSDNRYCKDTIHE